MKSKIKFGIIIDYIVCALLMILAIKKGGFYKSDTIFFNLCVNIIAIISIVISYIKNRNKDEGKNGKDKIGILILLLSLAYLLPVILKNYTSLNDSIFEMIRYFNIYLIYTIVKKSENKKIYLNSIIVIGVILVLFGIDQISNSYATGLLKKINSGYLTSNNIGRMSSTIQYANVFAIICMVSYFLCLENVCKNKGKFYLNNILQMLLLSGIALSGSRTVLAITFVTFVYTLIKNKTAISNIILNAITAFVYVVVLSKFSSVMVYIITILSIVLNFVINFLFKKYGDLLKLKNGKTKYIVISVLGILVISAFFIHTSIDLTAETTKAILSRNIYSNVNNSEKNILEFRIEELEEDTRYEISVFKINEGKENELVDILHYYSSTTGNFTFEIENVENLKHINFNVHCTKGSLKIESIKLNGKKVAMDYLLLPSDIIYRAIDAVYSSNSLSFRKLYIKDSLKISISSIKNFLFGIGGEGFKNSYKYVKTTDYSSTEVHNIYAQILLESGIVGLGVFLTLIIYILKKYKMNVAKILLICIFIHGFFDLDFSYMIILVIVAILIAMLEMKEINIKENYKYESIIKYVIYCLFISIWCITTVILILSNLATQVKVPIINVEDDLSTIESKIKDYEKLIKYDMFDAKYRFKVNEAYNAYLNKASLEGVYDIKDSKYLEMLRKFSSNYIYISNNESMLYTNLIDITEQYFDNIDYLVDINYYDNKAVGYDYYLSYIYLNVEKLYNINDKSVRNKAKSMSIKMIKTLEKNSSNKIINNYIKLFENLISV